MSATAISWCVRDSQDYARAVEVIGEMGGHVIIVGVPDPGEDRTERIGRAQDLIRDELARLQWRRP